MLMLLKELILVMLLFDLLADLGFRHGGRLLQLEATLGK
jgi:hypothetical protein